MRVFSVGSDGEFTEYDRVPFEADHEESNPNGILEDGPLLIIGRQVPTDLGNPSTCLALTAKGM